VAGGLRAAWQHITADAPDRVAGLRIGLRAIVPLVADPSGRFRSSTARDAAGSVAWHPRRPTHWQ
jgi:uncharacterized protein